MAYYHQSDYNTDTDTDTDEDDKEDEPSPYCNRCDRTFIDDTALTQHIQNSSQHYYCQPCCRDFVSYGSRQQHWKTNARHTNTYCDRCDQNFVSDEARVEHKRNTSSQHFLCEPCDMDYRTSEALKQHFIRSAAHQDTYCWKCETDFSNPNNLREHSKTHMPGDLICWGCDSQKRFATASAMLIHLESGTCPVGWTIQHINAVAAETKAANEYIVMSLMPWLRAGAPSHLAKNTDYSPALQDWVCSTCGLLYQRKIDLHTHLQSQKCSKGYPEVFKCPICADRFTTLSGMLQHVETPRCPASKATTSISELLGTLQSRLATPKIQRQLNEIQYKLAPNPDRRDKLIVKVFDTSDGAT